MVQAQAQPQDAQASEVTESQPEWKRKEKIVEEEVIPPEERLDRPEGALSLAEYREQLKEKNKRILAGANKAQTLKVELPSNLQVIEKESLAVKEKKVAKAKKIDNSVQQVSVNFQTEDLSKVSTNTRYPKSGYQNNNQTQNKKQPQKFKVNVDDLPSL